MDTPTCLPSDRYTQFYFFVLCVVNSAYHLGMFLRCRSSKTGHYLGGAKVDAAVNSVFAALLWHTQEMREQVTQYSELNIYSHFFL